MILLLSLVVLAVGQSTVPNQGSIADILRGSTPGSSGVVPPRVVASDRVDPARLAALRAAVDDAGLPPHPLKARFGAIGGMQGKDERGGKRPPFVPSGQRGPAEFPDLLGAYQTFYDRPADAIPGRVINIRTLANFLNGRVLQPGESFSVNELSGERKEKDGFVSAGAIVNGAAGKMIGGGISQLGTTTYNAAYFAGLRIDKHKGHSSFFPRYPKGRDATLDYPAIDVKFTNTSPKPVKIIYNWGRDWIAVMVYGTKFVKSVTASPPNPIQFNNCELTNVVRTVTTLDGQVLTDCYPFRTKPEAHEGAAGHDWECPLAGSFFDSGTCKATSFGARFKPNSKWSCDKVAPFGNCRCLSGC